MFSFSATVPAESTASAVPVALLVAPQARSIASRRVIRVNPGEMVKSVLALNL